MGGRLTSYESIVERARREAIVRLKQQAQSVGATHIMGVRLSTTELGMQGGMVEVLLMGQQLKINTAQPQKNEYVDCQYF